MATRMRTPRSFIWGISATLLGMLTLVAAACGSDGDESAAPTSEAPAGTAATTAASTVEVTKAVPYTSTQALDVYAPTEAGPWPVVVVLHGAPGSKADLAPLSEAIAQQGAVVFNADWRDVIPKFLEATEDMACAVRFARATAADYGGDPTRVTLLGWSAGGASGAVVALAGDDFEGDCLVSDVSALPDAFVGVAGGYNYAIDGIAAFLKEEDPDLWEAINPYSHIGRNPDLRVRSVHGDTDGTVPVEDALEFHQELKDAGYDVTLTVLEGEGHSLVAPAADGFADTVQVALEAARD